MALNLFLYKFYKTQTSIPPIIFLQTIIKRYNNGIAASLLEVAPRNDDKYNLVLSFKLWL
jgi:hypothetical protein